MSRIRCSLVSLFLLLLTAPALGQGVDPREVGSGELLARGPGGDVPLPRLHSGLEIAVEGIMVHATLTQTFHHPGEGTIEALYVFPLPEGASVHHMEMRVGERRIVSKVQERAQAQRTYTEAKREGKKAALVEQERGNLFTASLANLNAGETVEVRLEIVDEVLPQDGTFRWTFPLTFTPRFVPPSMRAAQARVQPPFQESFATGAPTAEFVARLRPGFELASLRCPSHDVDPEREGESWVLRPAASVLPADRDLVLEWTPRRSDAPRVAWLTEPREAHEYGLLLLLPPRDDAPVALATETLFVIDVSSSMDGPSIAQARLALSAALDRLGPGDRFDILRFNDGHSFYAGEFRWATPEELRRAQDWVRGLRAEGGTMIHPALLRALGQFVAPRPEEAAAVRRILFLTDGAVGNEDHMLERIAAGLGDVRLHTIGIGAAPNRGLMRAMAERGGGLCAFVSDPADAERRIDRFFATLARPVWTDLELEWTGARAVHIVPQRLPDLHAGEPLFVSARWPRDGRPTEVVLRARAPEGQKRVAFALDATSEPRPASLSQRWARRAVQEWMDALQSGRPLDEVRPAVVDLGVEHHIVTAYTSLVAVEERPTAAESARTTRVPNALPVGSTLLQGTLPRGGRPADPWWTVAWTTLLLGAVVLMLPRLRRSVAR